jgi:hypothetical protein
MSREPEGVPFRNRAIEGFKEGAAYGAAIGLFRGVIHSFRGTTIWYLEIGGSLLAGLIIGASICVIGRAISGRLLGACLGAIAGLFVGLFIGNEVGGYNWTTINEPDGTISSSGQPIGQMIGSAVGAFAGAMLGAFLDRLIRRE